MLACLQDKAITDPGLLDRLMPEKILQLSYALSATGELGVLQLTGDPLLFQPIEILNLHLTR